MTLIKAVDTMLLSFRQVFSRNATFYWFVIVVFAFLLRMEALGATSIIRCLGLAPNEYFNLLHFFS